MGHRHTREQILAGAIEAATVDGVSQLTFGRVAKHLGVNDRTVVYYFPTKEALLTDVMVSLGARLQGALAAAFTSVASDHLELAKHAWPMLARPEIDPIFSLFFEATGLAAAGREPYKVMCAELVDAWIVWLVDYFTGTPQQRRGEAEAAVALLDGLLLLRQLRGPAAANRAATRLGVR